LANIETLTATIRIGVQAATVGVRHIARLHLAGGSLLGKRQRCGYCQCGGDKQCGDNKALHHLEIPLRVLIANKLHQNQINRQQFAIERKIRN
jgi:hypothetical protein